jgi:hypothetical protein
MKSSKSPTEESMLWNILSFPDLFPPIVILIKNWKKLAMRNYSGRMNFYENIGIFLD